jgi:UDP-sugar pyrophosphorylase
LAHLNKNYPDGIKNYYQRSKQLVIDSSNSVNPYADYHVSIPEGVVLNYTPDNLDKIGHYERLGMKELEHTAFVLVAGGLGERLGYPGIKVAIPFDLLAFKTFLNYYIDYILAFQTKFCKEGTKIPLLIMTSGDTH